MGVFVGSEALRQGLLTRHQLRTHYRRVFPDVYAPKFSTLSLDDRTTAAWLWSHRQGVVTGLAASALHGARWIDDDIAIELNWPNHRAPTGIVTRNDSLLDNEIVCVRGLPVTSPVRTAFDLARRGPVDAAVARLDALARTTHFKADDVRDLAALHRHNRGVRRLDAVLDLVDAGAESPQETRLRLLLMRKFPRPSTQIPILRPDGYRRYYLDMGWDDINVGVEYDGEQHRTDQESYRRDIKRMEYIQSAGWLVVRVVAGDRPKEIVARVGAARASRAYRK
ncbi:hypothetical protein CRI77_22080 [Mycolicibacterium duvalii]|uniref:Uncharacterized protein n=1 Tax=Mycolicibacterium duvalii TaxID=39688 RepID=A0A7I7K3L2_9MYCO|nr:hypothetical protein [Mycolicibacterium duvalii]MCV7370654.1 hypothetical protein [Mycolicibacterium duvalii]PEG36856.1 hypothetical protein CRI77_22080 [Mycolicibacterium duvalii]BBX17962.1 hypothetical protein MDUV_28220 [Mycolicibacterium duvalii]